LTYSKVKQSESGYCCDGSPQRRTPHTPQRGEQTYLDDVAVPRILRDVQVIVSLLLIANISLIAPVGIVARSLSIDVLCEFLYRKRLDSGCSQQSIGQWLLIQSGEEFGARDNIRLYFEALTKRPAMVNLLSAWSNGMEKETGRGSGGLGLGEVVSCSFESRRWMWRERERERERERQRERVGRKTMALG
jgi:hypothetical protein